MIFDYAGAFHLHSSYSFDGNVNIDSIISAARRRGITFIVITDHFRLDAKTDGWEGWHDGVLVLVGEEISPRYNHYLALGIEKPVLAWQKNARPQEYIDAVNSQGGFGLIAHPDHTGAPGYGVKAYPWNDWSVTGFTGISIWDLMTDWQEKLTSPLRAVWAYLFPAWSLSGPKPETLKRWDELNGQRRVLGYGELDNHNTKKMMWGMEFRIFPYELAFTTVLTHIMLREQLSADFASAKWQVFEALRSARAYVAQDSWRKSGGFMFRIYDGKRTALCGEDFTLPKDGSAFLEARAHGACRIRLLRNGEVILEKETPQLHTEVEVPGVYRVEVRQKIYGRYKPWIYSNPIRVA